MIDISKLKTFVTVAELGSFSKASEVLYITQPAVTQQIKALEKTVGAKLFLRQGGRMVLTEEGKRIYEIAKNLLANYEGLMEEIARVKKDLKDTLFIGLSATPSEYLVPRVIADFHKQFPSSKIKVFSANSYEVEDALASGVLNVGIIEKTPAERFEAIPFIEDELIFFTYPEHPLAEVGEIEPHELYGVDLVLREAHAGIRKVVREKLEELGVVFDKLNIRIESTGSRNIIQIVKSGYGCSFLSKGLLHDELERGNLVEVKIKGFEVKRRFHVIYPKGYQLPLLASKFVEFLFARVNEKGQLT
ncbi:MAG: LysR family transcriptional regulator [Aquificae bacterium]|nr:LysR family transcriptional regulator [Aquificota bacterium]